MDIEFKPIVGGFFSHHRKDHQAMSSPFHYHDAYELYYCLDGVRNYLTHSKVFPLETDWITLTKPFLVHGTNGGRYERVLLSFSEHFLLNYFSVAMVETFKEVFSVDAIPARLITQNTRIKELFFGILESYNAKNLKKSAMLLGELLLILHELVQQVPAESNDSKLSVKMQEILSYVSENLSTIKCLDDVANRFYLSKFYLSHQFKSNTGFTFVEFLTKVKISRALHLLKHTDDTVANISHACGFDTPAYFCIVFKKKMNMTPLQYRTWIKQQTLDEVK